MTNNDTPQAPAAPLRDRELAAREGFTLDGVKKPDPSRGRRRTYGPRKRRIIR